LIDLAAQLLGCRGVGGLDVRYQVEGYAQVLLNQLELLGRLC
jgi:hypothetical protein